MSIQKGSRGQDVNDLQQKLIAAGYLGKEYNTGYFGDLTAAALKKYQSDKGLPVSGVLDDTTKISFNAPSLEKHPNIIGTDLGQYLENLKQTNPSAYYTLSVGSLGGDITPGMVKYATDQATNATKRYYDEDLKNSTANLNNYVGSSLSDYLRSINDIQNSGVSDFNALNDTEGRNGTWASSAREMRMKSLENNYNSKLQDLYNKYSPDLQQRLQAQEYNYGAANTPNISLDSVKANFSTSPTFQSTSSNIYNPFNFVGRKNAERSAGINSGINNILSSQFKPLTTN